MQAPRIEPRYLSAELDRKVIVAGIRMLREIYQRPAFRNLWDEEVLTGPAAQSDQQLLDFARNHGGTVFHASGTCRVGTDAMTVVDPALRVHGIERLRVIDASIMPAITSANTNAASLMIGEKGAELVSAGAGVQNP
jgi:choline dehydrogenase